MSQQARRTLRFTVEKTSQWTILTAEVNKHWHIVHGVTGHYPSPINLYSTRHVISLCFAYQLFSSV